MNRPRRLEAIAGLAGRLHAGWRFAARSTGPQFTLDLAAIVAIALLCAAYYCVFNVDPPGRFRPLFPPLGSFGFRYYKPAYYAWTDLAENIYLGFLVAHGERIYEAAVFCHMPGVPQLIGFFLWLFGFGRAVPSPQTAASAYLVASFATLVFQTVCVYGPLRLLAFPPASAALITLAVCASTAFLYDFAMPMSETLIAYLLVLVPILAAPMVFAAGRADRVAAAILLGGPVNLGCLILGLTVAPANALIGFACLAAVIWETVRDRATVRHTLIRDRRCVWAYGISLALVAVCLTTTKISDMYFWAIGFNLVTNAPAWTTLLGSAAAHLKDLGGLTDPIGSRYPHLVIALAVLAMLTVHEASDRGRRRTLMVEMALFAGLILAAAVLTQWRFSAGYKSAPMLGLTIGVALLALAKLPPHWRIASPHLLGAVLILGFGQIMLLRAALAYDTRRAARPAAFETAHICRFGETTACRCVQGTVFGPQIFLLTDMRACPDRYPTFNTFTAAHPVTRQWIYQDSRSPAVAFMIVEPVEMMIGNGIPPDIIAFWRGQARCERLGERNAFCFVPD